MVLATSLRMSALGSTVGRLGVFRVGSFARPIYRKEESERFRATSPTYGWSKGVPAIWKNYNLPYDIINNPFNYTEKLERAGVLHFTADVTDAPTNWACDAHHYE